MATSVSIDLRDYGEDYIKVRFDVEVTWPATYKVTYGIYELGLERTSGNFTLENGGTYTTSTTTFSGLDPGTEYTVWVSLWNAGTDVELGVTDEITVETDGPSAPVRPSDWSWSSTVRKGAAMSYTKISDTEYEVHPLTASEWNRFIDRIFEFMEYKGISWSGSTSGFYVTRGTEMEAETVDLARQLIATMNPPTALPSAVSSNKKITAAYINGLKNSLNSIS